MAVNELAYAGYWFYEPTDDQDRASLYASWGLVEDAPPAVEPDTTDLEGLLRMGTGQGMN
jgi:hypothetical protein